MNKEEEKKKEEEEEEEEKSIKNLVCQEEKILDIDRSINRSIFRVLSEEKRGRVVARY